MNKRKDLDKKKRRKQKKDIKDTLTFGEEVVEFLNQKEKSTQVTYRVGLMHFLRYYKGKHGDTVTLSDFLDRLDENALLTRRKRTRLAENEANNFIRYMTKLKLSKNSMRVYFAAVQNFLKYKGFEVSGRFVKLPSAISMDDNLKHAWTIDEIRDFVSLANSMRDKAIILCLFQSGMGVGELCMLDYGDVKDELDANIMPLYLKLIRQKTSVEYKTFFGYDAIRYLKLYLETRRRLRRNSALFTMIGSNNVRVTEGAIQAKFRDFAQYAKFLKQHELKGYNPARPHSLRSAFRSRLTGKTDPDLIEFFMGHAIGGVKRAYMNLPINELRKVYAKLEKHLAISKTSLVAKRGGSL